MTLTHRLFVKDQSVATTLCLSHFSAVPTTDSHDGTKYIFGSKKTVSHDGKIESVNISIETIQIVVPGN